LFICFIPG